MTNLTDEIKEKKIKKYKKQVWRVLTSLYTLFRESPSNIQVVDQYGAIYKPLKDHCDPARLPVESKGKLAIKKKRVDCLFAMLNHTLEHFWLYCKTQENEAELMVALVEIKEVIKTGLDMYQIVGDEKGYYLIK